MTPIVKAIEKASVKLQPLDLSPNDYVSEFLEKLNTKDEQSKAESLVNQPSMIEDKSKHEESKQVTQKSEIKPVISPPKMVDVGLDACDLWPVQEYNNHVANNDQTVDIIEKHESIISDN